MKKRRVWLWVLCGFVGFCVAPVLIVGFGTGIGRYDIPRWAHRADSIVAESRALGLPMTKEELVTPKLDHNAAPLVIKLMATIADEPGFNGAQADWVANNTETLNGIQQALATNANWYVERDYDRNLSLTFPEYAQAKKVIRAFSVRSEIRATKGDVDGSLRDFRTSRNLTDKLMSDPTLIAMLVAIAGTSTSLRSVERCADSWKNDPVALRKLEQALIETRSPKDPTQALRGEFYSGLAVCRNMGGLTGFVKLSRSFNDEGPPPPEPKTIIREGLPRSMFEKASFAVMANRWNQVFVTRPKDGVPWRNWAVGDEYLMGQQAASLSEMVAAVLMPVYAQAEVALKRDDVNQDLAIAFVRCMRYRAENHRWPKSLSEIDANFPDPFNPNGTIRASFASGELRVWSIGINKLDDRGRLRNEDNAESDDLVFVWPVAVRKEKR